MAQRIVIATDDKENVYRTRSDSPGEAAIAVTDFAGDQILTEPTAAQLFASLLLELQRIRQGLSILTDVDLESIPLE